MSEIGLILYTDGYPCYTNYTIATYLHEPGQDWKIAAISESKCAVAF